MKQTSMSVAFAMCVLTASSGARAYETLQGPTEVRFWDASKAYDGLTFFAASGKTYLIDMKGNVVHKWDKIGTNPHLLSDGSVLDASANSPSGFPGLEVVDWDGNVTWSYVDARTDYSLHHDFERIYNPKLKQFTTIYIANQLVTQAEALAAGADPAKGPYTGAQMDTITEVDSTGVIVWEWRFLDHVIQTIDATKANYAGAGKTAADYPGRIDINMSGNPLQKDWLHCNSLDYDQALDQIVINSVQGEFYVIDHGGTFVAGDPTSSVAAAASKAGDFLYRFGDPARYRQGNPPSITANWTVSTAGNKQIGGAHDISWIPAGLQGAGHFLVFNNGQLLFEHTPQSYIFEINPYLDGTGTDTGHYVNPPDAGYTVVPPVQSENNDKVPKNVSKQISWSYGSKSPSAFFSTIGGSAQRLPNGNTFICADTDGHLFEIAADGSLAWEYVNPVVGPATMTVLPDNYPMTNSVFRAYRYATDAPAFAGRTLTSMGTITGSAAGVDGGSVGADTGADAAASPSDAGAPAGDAGDAGDADASSAPQCPSVSNGGGGCSTGDDAGWANPLAAGLLSMVVAAGLFWRRGERAPRSP